MSFNLTSTSVLRPSAPGHDVALKLPNGKTVAETSSEELRSILDRLGLAGAHVRPMSALCQKRTFVDLALTLRINRRERHLER